ncbi:TonB-dependent receptor [Coraliomargarita parva]|uniref:TonB-dependent receptor n=1 Tax=Coraliomargarita parva TaxID=3014050 RepID=UPI0022B371DD|nr:TonB-dependent receptor [Coraliomargarita parva]
MLKPLTTIGLAAFCALGNSLSANSLNVVELEPFLVSPDRYPSSLEQPSLLGQEWRNRGAVGLAEALESAQPGISLVRKAGMSNDVVMRGLGGDDISVTLDGRKIFCACSNRMDPPLSQATGENAERVEIAAGPFSLKRSGSLGGHINIVSAPIDGGWHGELTAGLGSYSQQQHSVWASYGEGPWAMRVQGAYLYGDPYETGDGLRMTELPADMAGYLPQYLDGPAYEAWHAGAEYEWRFKSKRRLRFNFLRREDSDVLFPGLKMDADKTETTQLGLRLSQDEPAGVFESWVLDAYFNDTDHLMTDSKRRSSLYGPGNMSRPAYVLERGYFMRTNATARNWGATFDAEVDGGAFGDWEVGGELGQRLWDSENTILNINNAMLPDVLSSTAGVYAEFAYAFATDWQLEGGGRLDAFKVDPRGDTDLLELRRGHVDDYTSVEPGAFVSLRYQVSSVTAVFAGLGSVARTPNPQELYIQVDKPGMNPDWLGNPDLDAPRSTELTAGVEYTEEGWNFRLRAFHSWLDDYIYPVALGAIPDVQSYDNLDARLYGVELSAGYQLSGNWSLAAGLAWQEGRKESGFGSGNRALAEIPPLRFQSALQYQTETTELKLELQASDRQDRIDPDLYEQDLGSWLTVSVYAQRKLGKHWTLSCAVTNLFDENYAVHNAQVRNPFSTFTVVNEPGRVLKASLSYAF